MEVARHGLDPGVGDSNERLRQVVVGEAYGFEHGARRSLVAPVSDTATAMFEVHGSFAEHVSLTETMEGRASSPVQRFGGRAGTPNAQFAHYALTAFGSGVVSESFFLSDGSHDIIARNCSPTFSIGCCFSPSRSSANFLPPSLFSLIHSLANRPF